MPTKKITDLTQLTDLDATDSFVVNDSGAGADKRVEFSDLQSEVLNGASIGTSTAITELQVDNLNLNGNTISSTDTNGNIIIEANGTGDVIVNEGGGDSDFRVEGLTDQNLLFVDASTDRVGIGTSSPDTLLNLSSSATDGPVLRIENLDTTVGSGEALGSIEFYSNDSSSGGAGVKGKIASLDDNGFGQNFAMTFSTGVATGGGNVLTERLRIDSSGRLVFNPASISDNDNSIFANSNGYMYMLGGTNGLILNNNSGSDCRIRIEDNNTIQFQTSSSTRITIDSSGNVTMKNGLVVNEDQGNFDFRVEGDTDSHLIFADASADRVGIGTSTPATLLDVDGLATVTGLRISTSTGDPISDRDNGVALNDNVSIFYRSTASGQTIAVGREGDGNVIAFYRDGAVNVGSIAVSSGATAYNMSSDVRLKKNISDAEDASSIIDSIKIRKFDWKNDDSHNRYGTIAQELIEVFPEAVTSYQDPDQMMGVDYSKMVPMLIKEIQSLRLRVHSLENK